MTLMVKRQNGEIRKFVNEEYLSAYYLIPQSMLDKCKELTDNIPRRPRWIIPDPKAIEAIESDLFRLFIIDAYAFMVWPFMGLGRLQEIYSGYYPPWKISHSPGIWIYELEQSHILLPPKTLLCDIDPTLYLDCATEEQLSQTLSWLVPQALARHNLDKVIEIVKEYPCFEDFDKRNSNQKIDFYRKWYHTRTKHPQISLERYKQDYAKSHNGMEWDLADTETNVENDVVGRLMAEQFMEQLSEKDRAILQMRMEGLTLQEIANKLGYKNHSGVLKRLRKIGLAFEEFAGVDYGFCEEKII